LHKPFCNICCSNNSFFTNLIVTMLATFMHAYILSLLNAKKANQAAFGSLGGSAITPSVNNWNIEDQNFKPNNSGNSSTLFNYGATRTPASGNSSGLNASARRNPLHYSPAYRDWLHQNINHINYTNDQSARSWQSHLGEYNDYGMDGFRRLANNSMEFAGFKPYFNPRPVPQDSIMQGLSTAQTATAGLSLLAGIPAAKRLLVGAGASALTPVAGGSTGIGVGTTAAIPTIAGTAAAIAANPSTPGAIQRLSSSIPLLNRIPNVPNWLNPFTVNSANNIVDKSLNHVYSRLPSFASAASQYFPRLQPHIDRLNQFVQRIPRSITRAPGNFVSNSYEYAKDLLIPGSSFRHFNFNAPADSLRSATSSLLGLGGASLATGFALHNIGNTLRSANEFEEISGKGESNLVPNALSNIFFSLSPKTMLPFAFADAMKQSPNYQSPMNVDTFLKEQDPNPAVSEPVMDQAASERRGPSALGRGLDWYDRGFMLNPLGYFTSAQQSVYRDMYDGYLDKVSENLSSFSLGDLSKHLANNKNWSTEKAVGLPLLGTASGWYEAFLNPRILELDKMQEYAEEQLKKDPNSPKLLSDVEQFKHKKDVLGRHQAFASSVAAQAEHMAKASDEDFDSTYLLPARVAALSGIFDPLEQRLQTMISQDSSDPRVAAELAIARDFKGTLEQMVYSIPNPQALQEAMETTEFNLPNGQPTTVMRQFDRYSRYYLQTQIGGEEGARSHAALSALQDRLGGMREQDRMAFAQQVGEPILELASQPIGLGQLSQMLASRKIGETSLYDIAIQVTPEIFDYMDLKEQLFLTRNQYTGIMSSQYNKLFEDHVRSLEAELGSPPPPQDSPNPAPIAPPPQSSDIPSYSAALSGI
jgi:hypothetical protein